MTSLAGKTIRWRFDDGPTAGTTFEHVFHEDGSVTWRVVDGEHAGATAREESYAAVRVNETTWAMSYLSASGHTLTVVLDFHDRRAYGFASDGKASYSFSGTFELAD
jgi:molybdenum cofactor biosynthesis protein MoaF